MNSDTAEILKTFDTITLDEIDNVKLLNRVDTKYTFNAVKLPDFLNQLRENYFVLDINCNRICRYETLYYDTADLNLYRLHHNGKLNRYKVRSRKYVESDTVFFEIKFKSNKDRTIKSRVKRPALVEEIEPKANNLLQEKAPHLVSILKPAIWIYYSRITLVSKSMTERLTIDIGLNFKVGELQKIFSDLVIVELKQDSSQRSVVKSLMQKMHIKDVAISKYCLGIASLYPNIKKNRFKQKIREINKINYENV